MGGSDWLRVRLGRGSGEERDKEGLMLQNVQEGEHLKAPWTRAEKESRHRIRSFDPPQ